MAAIPNSGNSGSNSFQKIVDAFLSQPGLPFADVLSAERIERIFAKPGNLFGNGAIYSTSVMVWAFLGQVLRDSKEASCQAAVAFVVSYCLLKDLAVPTSDTGDYCRARAKLSEAALRDLTREIAAEVEEQADPAWLWLGLHAKLVDGFTFTMPDTEQNQRQYPQSKSQKPGVGFPIARAVTILSLATAWVMDLAVGPRAPTAGWSREGDRRNGFVAAVVGLFRGGRRSRDGSLLLLLHDDCVVVESGRASLCADAPGTACRLPGTDRRLVGGRRLGKYDHIIVWTRPPQPTWMDQKTYDTIPETLEMREIRYNVIEDGFRTETITIATTLTDAEKYSKQDIAERYGFRWNSELDIRSIKDSLNLGHVRCKSPEMVRNELWTTLLGYNLIRTTAAAAALLHDKQPRQISFTSTCQYILSSWMLLSCGAVSTDRLEHHCLELLSQIASCEVANRPGRLEPRVLKRRRHGYKLMQEPRSVLRAQLRNE